MKKYIYLLVLIALQIQFVNAQWLVRSSGFPAANTGIIQLSAPDQLNCYGIGYDAVNFGGDLLDELTITHDGGMTWKAQSPACLNNQFIAGVSASSGEVVHIMGWDYINGGGNVFRSHDGGNTWSREAANAFTDPASFPDDIAFLNANDGVMFGDPESGYFEVYTTHDGGNTWNRVSSANLPTPLAGETGNTFFMEHLDNTLWTVTIDGRLLQSDNKGETWYVRNPGLTLVGNDGVIRFRNHSVGLYKNNGILYRTTDGGTTFTPVNYHGTFYSFDMNKVPGLPGVWVSTGGDSALAPNALHGYGSSVSFDDGNHWFTIDNGVNHTCVVMTSAIHGYSGGITSGSNNDGVFVYNLRSLFDFRTADETSLTLNENKVIVYPNPSNSSFNLAVNAAQGEVCSVQIYSIDGRKVIDQIINPNEVTNLGNGLPAGIYQAMIYVGSDRQVIRLVKE